MSDPRLKTIADAVLSRIEGISVAGGYNFDAGSCARAAAMADDATSMPAAYIIGVGFEERHLAHATDGPFGREATALLQLRLFVTAVTNPQLQAERWAYDVVRAVEGLPTGLGLAYVISVIARNYTPMVTDAGIQAPYGMANMTIAVTYRMARGEI